MGRIDQYPECTTPVDNDLLLIETEEGTKKVKKSTLLKAVVDLLGDDDISEIGDGTVTGAITDIKDTVTDLGKQTSIPFNTEEAIGTLNGKTLYRKLYHGTGSWNSVYSIDSNLKSTNISAIHKFNVIQKLSIGSIVSNLDSTTGGTRVYAMITISNTYGLAIQASGYTVVEYWVEIEYTKET